MVTLVWWILSLFGICEFTWLPVFADAVCTVYLDMREMPSENGATLTSLSIATGVAYFAFLKYFLGLTLSAWWVLASPIAFIIAFIVPGGFTIVNLLFQHFGWIQLPTWALIIGIVIDVLSLILLLGAIINNRRG